MTIGWLRAGSLRYQESRAVGRSAVTMTASGRTGDALTPVMLVVREV